MLTDASYGECSLPAAQMSKSAEISLKYNENKYISAGSLCDSDCVIVYGTTFVLSQSQKKREKNIKK